MDIKHLSLFNGIGGFQLAAQWCGWDNVASVEIDKFCNKVTKYHFPNCKQHEDIKKFDGTPYKGIIDVISGGFPCQPYSQAGKRLGKADERHLWPEMLRIICEVQPRYVVGENVRGITNWSGGLVFDEVQSDLEAQGYEVLPFLLPACAVNAPHRRDRIWFIAHNSNTRAESMQSEWENGIYEPESITNSTSSGTRENVGWLRSEYNGHSKRLQNAPNSDSIIGRKGGLHTLKQKEAERYPGTLNAREIRGNWQNFPTQPPLRLRDDGFSRKLVKFVKNEFYATITEENRIKDLPEMWARVSAPEVWEQIRGLYSLEHQEVLLQTMQLYQAESKESVELSPFSENISEPIMRKLRKYGQFGRTPQGQELQKQREREYTNSLSFLPHEIALAARAFETQLAKFDAWHRNESIKGYGNAIVPQVAVELFNVINQLWIYSHTIVD